MEISEIDRPGVSVITVNSGRNMNWLRECRKSVMGQRTVNFTFEHIIIDNILKEKQYSQALNEGVKVSKNHFILVLDDDDELHPDTIEILGNAMMGGKKNNSLLYRVSSFQQLIDILGNPIGKLNSDWIGLIDKELLMTLGGFPAYGWDFCLHPNAPTMLEVMNNQNSIDKKYGSLISNQPLYAKRIHGGMMSFLHRQELYEEILYNANLGRISVETTPEGDVQLREYEVTPRETSPPIDLSKKVLVGIVTHNNERTIGECLSSVALSTFKNIDVMVVDNNSEDKTIDNIYTAHNGYWEGELFRTNNKENEGFAYGCNQILQRAKDRGSEYGVVLLLNPDAYLPPNGIEYMLACAERHNSDRCGIVGAEELTPNGDVAHNLAAYIGKESEFDKVRNIAINWNKFGLIPKELEVPAVTFACAMIMKPVFDIAKFDTSFGLGYFEDIDFCLLTTKKGFTIWSTPYVKFVHHKHISWSSHGREELNKLFKKNYCYLIKKHGDPPLEDIEELIEKWKEM
jgi:GT2 family glycosyltransferase